MKPIKITRHARVMLREAAERMGPESLRDAQLAVEWFASALLDAAAGDESAMEQSLRTLDLRVRWILENATKKPE